MIDNLDNLCNEIIYLIVDYLCHSDSKNVLKYRLINFTIKSIVDDILFQTISSKTQKFRISGRNYYDSRLTNVGYLLWNPKMNTTELNFFKKMDILTINERCYEDVFESFARSFNSLIYRQEFTMNEFESSLEKFFHPIDEFCKRLSHCYKKWLLSNTEPLPFHRCVMLNFFPLFDEFEPRDRFSHYDYRDSEIFRLMNDNMLMDVPRELRSFSHFQSSIDYSFKLKPILSFDETLNIFENLLKPKQSKALIPFVSTQDFLKKICSD